MRHLFSESNFVLKHILISEEATPLGHLGIEWFRKKKRKTIGSYDKVPDILL
jgi:hypothetical protein